jgi:hypothetical protein
MPQNDSFMWLIVIFCIIIALVNLLCQELQPYKNPAKPSLKKGIKKLLQKQGLPNLPHLSMLNTAKL